jgi:hypothetical protein
VRDCGDDTWDSSRDWPCGGNFPEELPWETYGEVVNRSVIYFADAVPSGSVIARLYNDGAAIAAGYHLFSHVEPTPEQGMAFDIEWHECSTRAWERTLADLEELIGTEAATWPIDREHVGTARKLNELAWLAEGCPRKYRLIASTEDEPVELQFLDKPSLDSCL